MPSWVAVIAAAAQVRELKAQGLGATEIAKALGMGRASVYLLLGVGNGAHSLLMEGALMQLPTTSDKPMFTDAFKRHRWAACPPIASVQGGCRRRRECARRGT